MTGATIKSVFVKTGPSEIKDGDNLGYDLQKPGTTWRVRSLFRKPKYGMH